MRLGGGAGQGPGAATLPGGEGPGGPPSNQAPGAARDLGVVLSDDGQNLIISLTPNDTDFNSSGVTYSVFWLSPAIFSQQDIYGVRQGAVTGQGLNLIQGRRKVVDIAGGEGVVSYATAYLPYVTGGWMYATVIPPGSVKEFRLSGTNFVAVPVLGPAGEPLLAEVPTNFQIAFGTAGPNALVQFSWRNNAALTTVAYVKIATSNYLKDGFYEEWATYKVNTGTGQKQGTAVGGTALVDNSQTIVMEHNTPLAPVTTTFYCIPMSPALVPLRLSSCPSAGVSDF